MSVVMREVRRVTHFDPKSDEDLLEIEARDPSLGTLLRKRRRGRPYGHDIIDLKCGHTVFRVRPRKTYLWMKLPCEMCTMREAELSVRYVAGEKARVREQRRRDELAQLGDEAMKAKKASKSNGTTRAWKQSYRWTKALKLEPPAEGIRGIIYNAMRTVKSGSVDDVTAAAVKKGLDKKTKQDPRMMTQSLLRQLAEDGCCEIVRDDAPKAEKKDTAPSAKKSLKKKAKKVVLKKSPAAASAQANA